MFTNVLLGLVVLFVVILLAMALATVASNSTGKPVMVDKNQPERTLQASHNLKHEGNWQAPRLHK